MLKTVVNEERPCRAVVGAAASSAPCLSTGDRSFPSNHAAIAGAAAVALACARPRTAWFTVPMALLMALSGVFVGVRCPHDVAVLLLVGGSVAALVTVLLSRPTRSLARTVRDGLVSLAVWISGPGAGGPAREHSTGH
ncbi:phosphatase PAP2 family protein [Streptomyces sp. NPDC048496]|uniref:phosphatase PAP2 family protein n=1 Tax=Streptomyces sp. NPDC048496 TaxID=3365558 RepID=UPI00371FEEFF